MASIRKRGDKYQVQIRRQGNPAVSKTFHRKADAQQWARQAEADADKYGLALSNTKSLLGTALASMGFIGWLRSVWPAELIGINDMVGVYVICF